MGNNRSVNELADMIGGDRINVEPVIEPKETLADHTKALMMLPWIPETKIENWVKKWKKDIGL